MQTAELSQKEYAVVPDIHNKTWLAESIAKKQERLGRHVIFLGDYFDSYQDNPEKIKETAKWLKQSLKKPTRTHLMGNHDFAYAFPTHPHAWCPGWSPEKQKAVESEISQEELQSLQLCKLIRGERNTPILLSHAGINLHTLHGISSEGLPFEQPKDDPRIEEFKNWSAEAHLEILDTQTLRWMLASKTNKTHRFHHQGTKVGEERFGGPYWLYLEDIYPIPNLGQIIGHNPMNNPVLETNLEKNGWILHIDGGLRNIAIVTPQEIKTQLSRPSLPPGPA